MAADRFKLTPRKVRDKLVNVEVDDRGKFHATNVEGASTWGYPSLETLQEDCFKLLKRKAKKVHIECCTLRGVSIDDCIVYGRHQGTHKYLCEVTENGRTRKEQRDLYGDQYRKFTSEERSTYVALYEEARAARAKVDAFLEDKKVNVRKIVDEAMRVADVEANAEIAVKA